MYWTKTLDSRVRMNRRAMEQALIPMARPSWNGEMREAAIQTLDSGRWVKGPHSKNFGQEFADYIGVPVASPCQVELPLYGLLCAYLA